MNDFIPRMIPMISKHNLPVSWNKRKTFIILKIRIGCCISGIHSVSFLWCPFYCVSKRWGWYDDNAHQANR